MSQNSIPDQRTSDAANWLRQHSSEERMEKVVANGQTALFWYIAALLAAYSNAPTDAQPTATAGK